MRGSLAASLLLAPLVVTLAACGSAESGQTDPLSPVLNGRYDVVTWEAKPLPDTLRVIAGNSTTPGGPSFRCPEVLTGATLDVASDGTLSRTMHLAYPCTGTLPSDMPDTLTQVATGTASVAGSKVTLTIGPTTAGVSGSFMEYGQIRGTDIVIDEVHSGMNFGSVESRANARVYRHE